jgi:putative ABC transport system permease protein
MRVRSGLPADAAGDLDRSGLGVETRMSWKDMAEEVAQHLRDQYAELRAAGHSHQDAMNATSAEIAQLNPGEWPREVRHAARSLSKARGFSLIVILTLALGIGANAAIFSVVNAVVLRPLPYQDPDRLVVVWDNLMRHQLKDIVVSALEYTEFRDRNRVFERMAAYDTSGFNITGIASPERVNGAVVTASLLPLIGVRPALGRVFEDADQRPGVERVVLSHAIWQRIFAGDRSIVGRAIAVDGKSAEVVGVMPAGFHFPDDTVEIWKPLVFDAELLSEDNRGSRSYTVIARLKAGVTVDQAQAEMNVVSDGMVRQHPQAYRGGYYTTVRGLQDEIVGGTRRVLLLQFGAVGLVLLIACANVANLLLARGGARRKEMAIRRALGAKRSRIVGQLLTESVLLAVCGGAVGLIVAVWGLDLLIALAPSDIPRLTEIALDARVVAFTAVVSLLTGVLFGVVPALQMSRTDPGNTLKEGGRSGSAGRRRALGDALIVAQVALSLVLLVAAGLLINSFARVQAAAPGFNPERVLTMRIAPPDAKYSFERGEAFFADLVARLRATPGVRSVGAINALPFSGTGGDRSFYIEGRSTTRTENLPDEDMRFVTPGYFATMQIPVLQGREFSERDTLAAPRVAVINQALARKYFPAGDAIGTRVAFTQQQPVWYQIIGVVGAIRHRALDARELPELYVPNAQPLFPGATVRALFVAVRTDGDPLAMTAAVRQAVAAVDPDQPISDLRSMEQRVSASLGPRRFNMVLLGVFAAVALALCAIGIYGVLAYAVTERTHEIGIRLALGARPRDVIAMVVGQGLALAVAGAVLGVVAAAAVTRLMASLLYGVTATDPLTFGAVVLLLLLVAAGAAWRPARRATQVDPLTALRAE